MFSYSDSLQSAIRVWNLTVKFQHMGAKQISLGREFQSWGAPIEKGLSRVPSPPLPPDDFSQPFLHDLKDKAENYRISRSFRHRSPRPYRAV